MSDPTKNYHGGAETSVEANAQAEHSRHSRMKKVEFCLNEGGGMTSEDLELATGISHQSMGGIILKLIEENRIHRPGPMRETRTGAMALLCFPGPGLNVGRAARVSKEKEYADLIQKIANAIARGQMTGPAADAARIAIESAGFRGKA